MIAGMKKVIAFDLDGTLADSKSPMDDKISDLLAQLLNHFEVCVMSGGRFEQFQVQFLSNLKVSGDHLKKLHLMPTCGTRYYKYQPKENRWQLVYAEDLTQSQKDNILHALNQGIDALGLREKQTWGDTIEDRESQITFSALGQDIVKHLGPEGVKRKEAWDPDGSKKHALRDHVAALIPEFEVRIGGGTSIDITRPGIDKAYGIQKLTNLLGIAKEDILFIGDRLEEGGNDYPVKLMGVDSIEVSRWQDTAVALQAILHVL